MSTQTLSVCLIVRNEATQLADCLASVQPVAEEIIVVDTGSSDGSPEIARKAGARVFDFEWCDDFSAARNASIRYARGDWILWIDADERLDPESIGPLRECLKRERGPVIYRVKIRNLKADGRNATWSDAHRLFTNHRGIRFSGLIHEQISPSLAKRGGVERDSRICLTHFGYGLEGATRDAKLERNRKLLEKRIRTDPGDAYAHYTLAHNLKQQGQAEAAVQEYRTALEKGTLDPGMQASLRNALADTLLDMGKLQAAESEVRSSLQMMPNQVAGYYIAFKIAEKRGQDQTCLDALDELIRRSEKAGKGQSAISSDIEIDSKILQTTRIQLQGRVIDGLIREERFQDALDLLDRWEQTAGLELTLLERRAWIDLKTSRLQRALDTYLKMIDQAPQHAERWIRRVAGIYAKMGEQEKAVQILTALENG